MNPNFSWAATWPVLSLFLLPIGGGIPGGVMLAKSKGLHWLTMMVLYFISDIVLACVFEPAMLLVLHLGRNSKKMQEIATLLRASTQKTVANLQMKPGPFALIVVSFGADPMTGRAAAKAVGHGFITGWALAICGDMFYFALLMVSTLFLSDILGDGTAASLIILAAMVLIPIAIRKIRERFRPPPPPEPAV